MSEDSKTQLFVYKEEMEKHSCCFDSLNSLINKWNGNPIDKVLYNLFKEKNIILTAPEPFGRMFPPIFIIMVGFGIACKDRNHQHNQMFIDFMTMTKNVKILEDYEVFWKNPISSNIRHIPAQIIYKANNAILTDKVVKLKLPARLAVFKNNISKFPEKVKMKEFSAADFNWNDLFYAFRR